MSGLVITYGYDSEGRVNAINLNGQTLLTNLVYEPFGPPQSWTWVSGQTYSRTFDTDGRLSDYPLGLDTRYVSYDLASRITGYSHTNSANDRSFDYDLVDRLILDSDSTTSRSYAYDANGNRTGSGQNGANALYTIDPVSNRLLGLSGSMTKTYSYDAAGHLIGNGTTTFDWNAAGRLARTMTGALSNIYRYTGLGERVIKAGAYITQQPHRYVYDPQGHLIGEYDKNNALRQETVWLGDLPVAAVKKDANGQFQFYPIQADHLNAPRVILNSANTPVWRWDATDAFGTVQPNGDPDGDGSLFEYNLRFPGQFYDKETGLHYNYFRDYDPVTGRYIDSDPIGLMGGLNTYGYVGGNPINHSDSSGLFLDEAGLQTALQGLATATGITTSTISATLGGIAGILYPKPAGEGSDVIPQQDCPPDNDDKCSKLIAEIQDVMKQLNRRYMDQCRDKKKLWDTHVQAFEDTKRRLAKLVARAESNGCAVPLRAYEWLHTQCPVPGTPRNTSPGY